MMFLEGPSSDTDKALDNSPMRLKICDKISFAPDFTSESSFSDAVLLSQLLLLHRFRREIFGAQNCAFTKILDCKKILDIKKTLDYKKFSTIKKFSPVKKILAVKKSRL